MKGNALGKGIRENAFSPREIRYLKSLPAVQRVTRDRIVYREEFKRECVRRRNAGESPAAIFRQAGLDPALIGYKRIERCVARWRDRYPEEGADRASHTASKFTIPQEDRWDGASPSATTRPSAAEQGMELSSVATLRLIVDQQARRIDQLEHENARLATIIDVLRDTDEIDS